MTHSLQSLVAEQRRRQGTTLGLSALAAAVLALCAVLLMGLSGWFIAAAAAAGAGGKAAVMAFNYLLPSAGIRLLAILRTGARYGERLAGHAAALNALAEIRPALYRALARGRPEAALALSSGEASARLVQDVDAVETLFVRLSAPWAAGAALAAGLALTLLAGPGPALCLLVAMGLLLVSGRLLARRVSTEPGREVQAAVGGLKDSVAAYLAAGPDLVCYDLEDQAVAAVMTHDQRLGRAQSQVVDGEALMAVLQAVVSGLAAAAVLLAARDVAIPLAALAALSTVVALEGASGLLRAFERAGAASEAERRLDAVLIPLAEPARSPDPFGPRDLTLPVGGGVRLSPGARVALVGPSGCGKTQMLERLIGLRTENLEGLAIAGAPLARLTPDFVRSQFAYGPQDARLLTGSIRDNLRLGSPRASEAELWLALADAGLEDRVSTLAGGLDAWVGEGGARLSGGERRRLSLARALLRPSPWLVLDEPTEGLDGQTEALVIARLAQRLSRTGQGLLLVSHRPAPLALCERTLRLTGDEASLHTPANAAG
ncbi:MAG: ATP-binding cassette domain-containing protein [Phenylobacterium sp.]|uniref:amino acid ABC transporter ATP-binding/permease protein n=1 Tax=Phenylobacterium sp. TaxID=1871053 RepID=UPI00271A2396|nr:ATP-binding cassette domain-containing protein [Phenylobacterium sp.]MDO8902357.1 ATP-binding cassette domain-containing protein [Phenylobacterium sp.]